MISQNVESEVFICKGEDHSSKIFNDDSYLIYLYPAPFTATIIGGDVFEIIIYNEVVYTSDRIKFEDSFKIYEKLDKLKSFL